MQHFEKPLIRKYIRNPLWQDKYKQLKTCLMLLACLLLSTFATAQSCSVSVSTSPPSPVPAGQSVLVDATLTVTQLTPNAMVQNSLIGNNATAEVDLDGAAICSSFADSCSTNVGVLAVGSHSLSWSCSGTGINENSGSQLLEVTSGTGPGTGPTQGFLPKYLLISILYPPPGNQSSVSFTDSISSSLTASITNTFLAGTSLSFTITPDSTQRAFPISPQFSVSSSTSASDSFAISASGSQGSTASSHEDFVDHYQDVFYIWLNPLILVTQTGPNAGTFTLSTPIGADGNREPMDVLAFSVTDLLNPDQIPLAKIQPIPIGGVVTVPGLGSICANPAKCTAADFADILKQDPLIFPFGLSDPDTSPSTVDSVRFQQIFSPLQELLFLDPDVRNTFSLTDSEAIGRSVSSTVQTSVGFVATDSTGIHIGPIPAFNLGVRVTDTFTFTEAVSLAVSTTASHQQQATLATSNGGCFEDINIFEDTVFHSFVLVPPPPSPTACGQPEPNFQFSATPISSAVVPGGTASYSVGAVGEFGFNSLESLSVLGLPQGANVSFVPASTIPTTGAVTMNIGTSSTTPFGDSTLTVVGSSAGITQRANVPLRVSDFAVSPAPPQTVTPNQTALYPLTVMSENFFTSVVTLSVAGTQPPGVTVAFTPATVDFSHQSSGQSVLSVLPSDTTPPGSYTLTVAATSGGLSRTATVTLNVVDFSLSAAPSSQTIAAGGSASYPVSVTSLNSFLGSVALSVSVSPQDPTISATFTPSTINGAGASTLNITTTSATPAGLYALTVTGTSGGRTHVAIVSLNVQNFTLAASPASQFVPASGACATYTINVSFQNGFSSPVTLSVSGLPPGINPPTISPNPVTGTGASTLVVCTTSTTPVGSYPIIITGTGGGLTHSTTVNLVVGRDFQISPTSGTPTSQTVTAGGSTSYSFTITPVNGFSDVVTLSLGSLPPGVNGAFNPSTVTGSGTSTLTISTASSTAAASYTLTIVGTSGGLSHATSASLTVLPPPAGDFAISSSTLLAVKQGATASSTITITPQNGFTGGVNLSVSGTPDFGLGSFNPATITITGTQPGTSALTISTSVNTSPGVYPITVTGSATSGSPSHSITINLTVVQNTPPGCHTKICPL
jgi:hypothetical protein